MNNQPNNQSAKKLAIKKQIVRLLTTIQQPADQRFPTLDC